MGMKFRFLAYLLLPVSVLCMAACSGYHTANSTGTGILYVTAQANTTVSAYVVTQSSGALSNNGNSIGTGSVPSAMVLSPAADALFVANSGSNSISSYTINSGGSLTAAGTTTPTGKTPTGLAIDPGGKFLFAANQTSSDISVFSISGTALTQVPGSPFTTIPAGYSYPNGTLPAAVAVSRTGKF